MYSLQTLLGNISAKKIICYYLTGLLLITRAEAQIKWDGGAGDGLWSSAANWSPDGVPNGSDDILLDNSLFTGTYSVQMPGITTTIAVKSIVITPASGNTITLILPSTNTASPGLNLTGSGDVMILNNGGIFQNSSGLTGGDAFGIPGSRTLRINNGGRYIHNTEAGNTTVVAALSTVAGTETGIFEFKVPTSSAYTISASGRTFGTLLLSTTGGTKTYTVLSAASPLTIRGDFLINSNASLTWSAVANIIVNGGLQQSSPSTINLSTGANSPFLLVKGDIQLQGTLTETGSGSPTVELNGTTNQNLSVTGAITNSVNFKINNSAGATLLSSVSLPAVLNLTNGKIKTTSTNLLTLQAGASASGGSSLSFVEGPLRKVGNTTFTFPVGRGTIYAPITTTNVSGEVITDAFTAEYKRQNPQSSIGNAVISGLNHVSYVEYWSLEQTTGTATKKVSLQVNPESFSKAMANTFVSRYNGSQWTNEGSTITSGPFVSGIHQTGIVESVNNLGSFGYFTLATNLSFAGNPLPVKLISFAITKNEQAQNILNWKLTENSQEDVRFVLERAMGNSSFTDIAIINGTRAEEYQFTDKEKVTGVVYYRLKIIESGSAITYSKIVVADKTSGLLVTVSPAILAFSDAVLEIYTDKSQRIQLMVADMHGRVLSAWGEQVNKGFSRFSFSSAKLPHGVYYIVAITPDGKKALTKFIRQ